MKRKFRYLLAVWAIAIILANPVLASYTQYIPLSVVEDNTRSFDMLPIIYDVDNGYLTENGYIADAMDVSVDGSANSFPTMLSAAKTLAAQEVTQDTIYNNREVLDNTTAATSHDIVFGYGGKGTINDASALEPGDNTSYYSSGVYLDTQASGGTLTNGTGTATGSPITLVDGANTITVTVVGTFSISLPDNQSGTATSGTTTVTGSPVTLTSGNNIITTTTSTGYFTVTLDGADLLEKSGAVRVYVDNTNDEQINVDTVATDYPTFRASNYGHSTAASFNCTLPAGTVAGDFVLITFDSQYTQTAPSGWSSLTTNTTLRAVYYCVVDSATVSTGYATVTTSSSGYGTWVTYAITNGTFDFSTFTQCSSASTSQDPPALSISETANTLWIVAATGDAISGAPSGYSNFVTDDYGTCSSAMASKTYRAASEDPGDFSYLVTVNRSWTLAISNYDVNTAVHNIDTGEQELDVRYNANWLYNSSFEVTDSSGILTGWSNGGSGSMAVNTTYYYTGSQSVELTATGAYYPYQTKSLTSGTYFTGGAWVWCDTPSLAKVNLYNGTTDIPSPAHPGDSQWHWLQATACMASTTNGWFQVRMSGAGTAYFDGAICVVGTSIPNIAVNSSFEAGDPPTDWANLEGTLARSSTRAVWGTYSASLTRSGTDCQAYDAYLTTAYRGLDVTFGAWVWASEADCVRVRVDDGVDAVYSDYHTGGSDWEWLEVTNPVISTSTYIAPVVRLDDVDTTIYFDGAVLIVGDSIPESYYNYDPYLNSNAEYTTNLVPNSDFEGTYNGWSMGGAGASGSLNTTYSKFGDSSISLTRNGTNCWWVSVFTDSLSGSETVTAGAWVWANTASAACIQLADSGGATMTASSSYHTGGSDWEWLTCTGTFTATPANARIGLLVSNTNCTVYYDGVQVVIGSSLDTSEFADGYNNLAIYVDGDYCGGAVADNEYTIIGNSSNFVCGSYATSYFNDFRIATDGILVGYYNPIDVVGDTAYSTGTVSGTLGDDVLTGSGTTFTSAMMYDLVYVTGSSTYYTITRVVDSTHVWVTPVLDATVTSASYNFYSAIPNRLTTQAYYMAITWGSNPSNIAVTTSPLTQTTAAAAEEEGTTTPNIVRGVEGGSAPSGQTVNSNIPLVSIAEFVGIFLHLSTMTIVNIGAMFLMFAIAFFCLWNRLGPVMTGVIMIALAAMFNVMHIFDYWMAFIMVSFIIMSWMLPRQTAVLG